MSEIALVVAQVNGRTVVTVPGVQGPPGIPGSGGGGLTDGDKGDIVVSGSGAVLTIDAGAVSTSKMGGDVTVAGKALLDDADATAQRSTLGLGTAATQASGAFAAASHTHAISDTTGLQAALDSKLDDSQATAAGLALLDDADASTQRTTLGLGTAATAAASSFAATAHVHAAADITSGTFATARLPAASTTAIGAVELATDGEAIAGVAVQGNDARLSNARTPTSHAHIIADTTGLQAALDAKLDDSQATAAGLSVLGAADAAAQRTALGLGTAATSATGAFAAASHVHAAGDVTSGTFAVARLPVATTTAAGAVELATDGEAIAGVVVQGNDARLSNARTPTTHSHVIADTTGLQTALDNKLDDSQATAAGLAVLGAASAAAQRTALGIVPMTTMFIGPAEMIPRTTNGAGVGSYETATNRVCYDTLEFDAATNEFATFVRPMPSNWNGGTITARFHWLAASGSGTVTWGIQAVSFSDNTALDTAYGTAQTTTDTLITAGNEKISAATGAVTIAGTLTAGNLVRFQIYRDVADTLGVDALLTGVVITYTAL